MNGRRNLGAKILRGDRKLTPPPPQYPQHFPQYDPPDGRKPKVRRSQSSIVLGHYLKAKRGMIRKFAAAESRGVQVLAKARFTMR